MARGLRKTLQVLTETRNEAAVSALLGGLGAKNEDRRLDCLRGLIDRRTKAGHLEVLKRWHQFDDRWKAVVAERAARMENSLRAAILSADSELHQNACDAVVYLHGYDLIPTLIAAAEDKKNNQAPLSARAVLSLCELLYHEIHAPRDYRRRRDPILVRQFIFAALEKAVDRFDHHRRAELIEAFLILARPDDPVLKQLLHEQTQFVHAAATNIFAHSQRQGIIRLLLRILEEAPAPAGVVHVFGRRSDLVFLRMMFVRFSVSLSPQLKLNLRKLDGFAWLREDMSFLRELSDEEMRGALHLILATGMNRLRAFDVLKFVMQHGGPLSRRAASAALVSFKGKAANELVVFAVDDPDPEVQANAVRQLRERGIPGVMSRLVELIDSPHEIVRETARNSLSEFNFQRFLSAFDLLQPDVRKCSGALVMRIDPNAIDGLNAELSSPSRARRLRGITVAVAMGVVPRVEAKILELAQDADHFVRAEAAHALVYCDSDRARRVLDDLANDLSVSVQEAAQQAVEQRQQNLEHHAENSMPMMPALDMIAMPTFPGELTS